MITPLAEVAFCIFNLITPSLLLSQQLFGKLLKMIALNTILIFYIFYTNFALGIRQDLRNIQRDHGMIVRNTSSVDLGDGFYIFEYEGNGDIVSHEFTPLAHIDLIEDGGSDPDSGTPVKRGFEIKKRAGTTCSDSSGKRKHIMKAKACLRAKAGGRHYNKHTSAHVSL